MVYDEVYFLFCVRDVSSCRVQSSHWWGVGRGSAMGDGGVMVSQQGGREEQTDSS